MLDRDEICGLLGFDTHTADLCLGATEAQWKFAQAAVALAQSDAERKALKYSTPQAAFRWLSGQFDRAYWYKRPYRCGHVLEALMRVAVIHRTREEWIESVEESSVLMDESIEYRIPRSRKVRRVGIKIVATVPEYGRIGNITWNRLCVTLREQGSRRKTLSLQIGRLEPCAVDYLRTQLRAALAEAHTRVPGSWWEETGTVEITFRYENAPITVMLIQSVTDTIFNTLGALYRRANFKPSGELLYTISDDLKVTLAKK